MDYAKTMTLRFRIGDLDVPERRRRYTSSREEEEEENAQMYRSGNAIKESRTHIVGECEMYKQERDVLREMGKIDERDTEKFGTLDSSEKTNAILGDRWWPQKAKQETDKISKKFLWNTWKKRSERPKCWRCLY